MITLIIFFVIYSHIYFSLLFEKKKTNTIISKILQRSTLPILFPFHFSIYNKHNTHYIDSNLTSKQTNLKKITNQHPHCNYINPFTKNSSTRITINQSIIITEQWLHREERTSDMSKFLIPFTLGHLVLSSRLFHVASTLQPMRNSSAIIVEQNLARFVPGCISLGHIQPRLYPVGTHAVLLLLLRSIGSPGRLKATEAGRMKSGRARGYHYLDKTERGWPLSRSSLRILPLFPFSIGNLFPYVARTYDPRNWRQPRLHQDSVDRRRDRRHG